MADAIHSLLQEVQEPHLHKPLQETVIFQTLHVHLQMMIVSMQHLWFHRELTFSPITLLICGDPS
jgi:hypothetical protein